MYIKHKKLQLFLILIHKESTQDEHAKYYYIVMKSDLYRLKLKV